MRATPSPLLIIGLYVCLGAMQLQAAQIPSAFTYQGRLNQSGSPATGDYDLRFILRDAATGSGQIGNPIAAAPVAVSNGFFTVTLDFGTAAFDGNPRWLEIGVRTNGSTAAYEPLTPRQPLTAAPYSFVSGATLAYTGAVTDTQLSGNIARLNSNSIFTGAVQFSNPASSFAGNFSGNGAGIVGINLLSANTGGAITWRTNSDVHFALASSPNVGVHPYSVVVADVNGDGKPDLINPNAGSSPDFSGTLSVLTNDGSGSFGLASSVSVGSNPYSVAAVDVNGDSKPDLVCANLNDHNLWVLTNDGGGGFLLSTKLILASNPFYVLASDLNGDGRMDLITANSLDYTLSILTNDGAGGFVASCSPVVGSNPVMVTASDVNGDGKVDLICANSGVNTLSVLTNAGLGCFALASSPTVGVTPYSVAAADLYGDGQIELISANINDNSLTIVTNAGNGVFGFHSSLGVGRQPFCVIGVDLNGDGRLDLVSANADVPPNFNGSLSLLTNNNHGEFLLASSPPVGRNPHWVTAADLNSDGRLDLISANYLGRSLTVLLNETPGLQANFIGNGFGLTDLNATNLVGSVPSALLKAIPSESLTGIIADSRLSSNVALLNANQTFTSQITFTNHNNSFTGNGEGLTGLRAENLVGSVPANALAVLPAGSLIDTILDARLSSNVALLNANQTFGGQNLLTNRANSFWGNGAGLTGLAGSNIVNGSIPAGKLDSSVGVWTQRGRTTFYEGSVGIGVTNPSTALEVNGTVTATAFKHKSDRNLKENLTPIDPREVLDKVVGLGVTRWNFKGDVTNPHLGPMAQDFYAAFGLGSDDRHIASIDAEGVALSAIKGLNEVVKEQRKEIELLEKRVRELELLLKR